MLIGICTVLGLNGTLVEGENTHLGHLNLRILASTRDPFRPTMGQLPNLAAIEKKQITVYKVFFKSPNCLLCIGFFRGESAMVPHPHRTPVLLATKDRGPHASLHLRSLPALALPGVIRVKVEEKCFNRQN